MRREHGQALVEAMVAIPLCMACALALVDCGLIVCDRVAAAQAASRAATASVVGGDVEAAARAAVPEGLRGGLKVELAPSRIRVTIESRARIARIVGHPIPQTSSVRLKEQER